MSHITLGSRRRRGGLLATFDRRRLLCSLLLPRALRARACFVMPPPDQVEFHTSKVGFLRIILLSVVAVWVLGSTASSQDGWAAFGAILGLLIVFPAALVNVALFAYAGSKPELILDHAGARCPLTGWDVPWTAVHSVWVKSSGGFQILCFGVDEPSRFKGKPENLIGRIIQVASLSGRFSKLPAFRVLFAFLTPNVEVALDFIGHVRPSLTQHPTA